MKACDTIYFEKQPNPFIGVTFIFYVDLSLLSQQPKKYRMTILHVQRFQKYIHIPEFKFNSLEQY